MADQTDKVWAIDRATKRAGQYDPAFLAAWPSGYLRIDPPTDLNAYSVTDLKAHAAARDIDLGDAKKKADIIAAIESHTTNEGQAARPVPSASGSDAHQEGGA
jgi:hypothetical protein